MTPTLRRPAMAAHCLLLAALALALCTTTTTTTTLIEAGTGATAGTAAGSEAHNPKYTFMNETKARTQTNPPTTLASATLLSTNVESSTANDEFGGHKRAEVDRPAPATSSSAPTTVATSTATPKSELDVESESEPGFIIASKSSPPSTVSLPANRQQFPASTGSMSNNDEFDDFLLEPTVSPPSTSQTFVNNNHGSSSSSSTKRPNYSNQASVSMIGNHNYSDVHPLLIYSIRYEIRSYDLYGAQQSPRLQPSVHSINHSPTSQASTYYSTSSSEPHVTGGGGRHSRTLIAGLKNTIGLDFYYSDNESYIFWTDVVEERIYKGTIINGTITNVDTVIQTGLATAEGLAVDWIGLNIYWVESTLDHIEVASINGTSRRTLIAGDMESPRAIAVDPRYGLLFWTDWDKKSPRIERATMAGEDREILVHIKEIKGGWPNGLTLDYEHLRIYWIDANSDSIHSVDYDGNNHQPLLKLRKSLGHPFSITLFENNLYWTDWKSNTISMANKFNGSDAKELQRIASRLFDIKVFHPSRQPKIHNSLNPCFLNNGNCSHLCLLSLNHTRRCECPPLMILAQDDLTCQADEKVLLIGKTNEIRVVDMNYPLHYVMAPISVPKVFLPRQFEYHAKSRTIFWADSTANEVKRAQLAGSSIETIIEVIIDSPSGLALDWISGNIYVTSTAQHGSLGKIFISNLDGEYISVLMDETNGLVSPRSIAVHPMLGLLFCVDVISSDTGHTESIIFVSTMNGENKRVVASKHMNPRFIDPSNLAIDFELNRVYWINQAINSSSIQYYDIMQDMIVTVLDESTLLDEDKINPSTLCVDGDFLFIGGRSPTEAIIKISKHNLTQKTVLRVQNLDQLSTIRVYNASTQIGSNACSVNNGNCSQLCVPTDSIHRVCKCTIGYSNNPQNQTECIGKNQFLIYSYNLGMRGISIQPNSSPDDYHLPPIHRAFRASSIDYVYRENLIYWVDNEEGSITRINRDTTDYQVVVQGLESEESIALDWIAGNIYWLDPYYDTIEVAHLNGSDRCVIVSGDMDKANGIVVNPIKGYIVWSDIGSYPKIETAMLDGSNRRVIVSTNLTHVDDLAIDYKDDFIYWLDSTLSLIERIKEDGTGRQIIYAGNVASQNPQNHLVSIALNKEYLYVADSLQHQGSILRYEKNTASERAIIQQHLGDGIRDITVFAEQPLPKAEENPCIKDNGGCQNLCIFMGEIGKRRCLCSHGKLNDDGRTCKPYDTFVLYSKLSQIDTLHIKDDESLNNSPYPAIAIENRNNIISLAVDYDAQRVIYSEISRDQICSILFNGTDRRVLVEKQSLVEGVAFVNDQLFWTSVHGNSISRFNTSSLGVPKKTCDSFGCKNATIEKIIELNPEDKPRGIAVDICTGYVYWTNWNARASIQRASPNTGYKTESIITTNIKVPNGIAIDQKQRKLYWCDARLDKIETCDMDGNRRVILISAAPQHPFALAVWENYVYWTDWIARGVFRAEKYTGANPVQIKKVAQRPMGIVIAAPEVLECSADPCSINNGGCPIGFTCIVHFPSTTECRPQTEIQHEVSLPIPRCSKYSRHGLCERMSYHDTIMDVMDRYNVTRLVSLESKPSTQENSTESMSTSTVFTGLIDPVITNLTTPEPISTIKTSTVYENVTQIPKISSTTTTSSTSTTQRFSQNESRQISETTTKNHAMTPATKSPPVNQSTLLPSPQKTSDSAFNTTATPTQAETTTPNALPTLNNTTAPPCQIVPAALQPTTTDASSKNECKQPNEYKCYLSDKLVCIPGDRRCDGNHDCPSKEDENDCLFSKIGPYNLKQDTNRYRFFGVILIILAAAVAALILVFGTRTRRRWFVNTTGAFNHRRMFDDNGTNIEISNPMFDEDDTGNLVHCAYSIDLNERTTNFSNPLYERQVLLMNEKHVTSN